VEGEVAGGSCQLINGRSEVWSNPTSSNVDTCIEFAPLDYHQDSTTMLKKGFFDALGRGDFRNVARVNVQFGADETILVRLSEVLPHVALRLVMSVANERVFDLLMRGEDWWGLVDAGVGYARIDIGAASLEKALGIGHLLEEKLDTRVAPTGITQVRVFTKEETSSCTYTDVAWSNIAHNYPPGTRDAMDQLVVLSCSEVKSAGGRIIVLHGPPGTGKTWAVRSLLTQWKSWAEGAIVLDPEILIDDPMYMLTVSRGGAGGSSRVMVIEDADQILEKRGTRPMSLSRLLNLTDGVVGASNDSLILMTTNSAPSVLDSALLRPGRCLASIEFGLFDEAAARQRLGANSSVEGPVTLAEIYGLLGETTKIESRLGRSLPCFLGTYL
jgi:ATPase family associated with various cellular activities (AAA)